MDLSGEENSSVSVEDVDVGARTDRRGMVTQGKEYGGEESRSITGVKYNGVCHAPGINTNVGFDNVIARPLNSINKVF